MIKIKNCKYGSVDGSLAGIWVGETAEGKFFSIPDFTDPMVCLYSFPAYMFIESYDPSWDIEWWENHSEDYGLSKEELEYEDPIEVCDDILEGDACFEYFEGLSEYYSNNEEMLEIIQSMLN